MHRDFRTAYHSICRKAEIPIQAQAFWWDALCGAEGWQLSAVQDESGALQAAMPYRIYRRRGLRYLSAAPPLATYGWLYTAPPKTDRRHSLYASRRRLTLALLRQLPAVDVVHFNVHPDFGELLSFRQMKWTCRMRITYVFDAPDASLIHARMASSARNHLRRAREALHCEQGGSAQALSRFYADAFRRRKLRVPAEARQIGLLRELLEKEGRGCQLSAFLPGSHDTGGDFTGSQSSVGAGKCVAACLLAWDDRRLHFLLSGQDEEGRKHRAMYLLIWEAIKLAARKGLAFDFDGSMLPEVEPVFRSFGARQQPYLNVFAPLSVKARVLYALSFWR